MTAIKKGRGRPKHVPTDELRQMVKGMSLIGLPQERIASSLDMSPTTLKKHYRDELDGAKDIRVAEVANNLFNIATGDSPQAVTAAIFIMKTQAGWKETSKHEVTGKDGEPLATTPVLNVTVAAGPDGAVAEQAPDKGFGPEKPVTH